LLKHAGIETTVTDLFKNPTVESLAKRIGDKPTGSQEDSAVPIKETGSSRPLFLVHELTGSLIYAHSLARFVGTEIPVYGIPPAKLMNAQTNVPALASRMVGIMRTVQPAGPYRVAGWSFGGVFAYEIAVQMLAQGREVEFLGLFDTHCPDPENLPERPQNANLFLLVMLQSASSADKFHQFEELKSAAPQMKLEDLVLICKERSLLPLRLAELPPEHIQRTIDHMRFLFRIYDGYAAPPISIPIHLFCHLDADPDPTLYGWKTILPASLIRAIQAPGTHLTMMEPGNIELLGKALTVALEVGHLRPMAEDFVGAAQG
jgi:thioesterase domain-containing protein